MEILIAAAFGAGVPRLVGYKIGVLLIALAPFTAVASIALAGYDLGAAAVQAIVIAFSAAIGFLAPPTLAAVLDDRPGWLGGRQQEGRGQSSR